jgi:type II secretory pathway pseudopilin PulG
MRVRDLSGISILETIIAFFIITVAILIVTQLFHSSLRYGRVIEDRRLGALLAENKLEEVRRWASDPDNFESAWSVYDNTTSTYPTFEKYSITTTLSAPQLLTPNSGMEVIHPVIERRTIASSTRGVTVECVWGSKQSQRLELSTLVAAPPRDWSTSTPLVITGTAPNPLPKDGTHTFTVQGFDDDGHELTDLTFNWIVLPEDGNGVVADSSRDGTSGTVGNWMFGPGGVKTYRPGWVQFTVVARYNGREMTAFERVNME